MTATDEARAMIERVARALAEAFGESELNIPHRWPNYVDDARAVLTTMREPTNSMLGAGGEAIEKEPLDSDDIGLAGVAWTAMIDAALAEKDHPLAG